MKPQIWKWKNFHPGVIVAAMRMQAIRSMLRDMWCAAVRALAEKERK